jgi:hypothetical protein
LRLTSKKSKAHSANPAVNFPLPAVRHFEAFAFTDRRGFVPESHNFDDDERDTMSKRVKELKAYKRSDADKPDVKTLAHMLEHRVFIEAFDNLLATTHGAVTAPLTYTVRTNDDSAADIDPAWDYEETLCATLELTGAHYKINNKRVWTEFKALVVEGPAWTHVKRV